MGLVLAPLLASLVGDPASQASARWVWFWAVAVTGVKACEVSHEGLHLGSPCCQSRSQAGYPGGTSPSPGPLVRLAFSSATFAVQSEAGFV